ncbi:polyribonucleotide nucleotidyltransferase [Endomicrobium proavitum]|uniref:Polyribonucleotide nucleotidyltransferase n=1 Tax=Endomicrobium proavitum TaxID=1408281 RepID=A0A0G3WJC6_9BACT|nr:polyribonucleotide nucleotidyltransferase [Endomicrobium proavitum]AKL97960.1 polynucleotide phosphorylase/polyadenylase [Endomicrobium proavitum]
MQYFKKEIEVAGKKFVVESGKVAKQASGACTVTIGETVVLVTAVSSKEPKVGIDFMPLTVDYRERTYAAGKIPGGFFKREAKPRDSEILVSRIIDRSIRPLFPEYWRNDTQISAIVLSYDGVNDTEIASVIGTSVALITSDIPFTTPIACVRIGRVDGKFVINPTKEEQKTSDLDLLVSGTDEAVTMVEAASLEISETEMLEALELARNTVKAICEVQKAFPQKKKIEAAAPVYNAALKADIDAEAIAKAEEGVTIKDKDERESFWSNYKKDLTKRLLEKYPEEPASAISAILEDIYYVKARELVLNKKVRTDGRGFEEIRSITCETGFLPRAHGSALFTRGQTQALVSVTLGTPGDKQILDELAGESKDRFLLHYNFPGFSTGEPRGERSTSRREIGHGNLAKRALRAVLPKEEDFGYTIRIVSDILESNGSSSMASVCGGSLALFNAGVPVKAAVAGVAMGLIKEGDNYVVLTDIMGMEDHLGDMDFKVAGTKNGITALQMDIKISGLTHDILTKALDQAKRGRFFILDKMDSAISAPSSDLSVYAPRMETLKIPQNKIGELIGPGGKNIRKLQEATGAKVDIDEDGTVYISGIDNDGVLSAKAYVESLTVEVEVGKIYEGRITKIMAFGAFAEVLPGKEGLIHISQLSEKRVAKVEDAVSEGDTVTVKVLEIDKQGRVNLSIKAVNEGK